MRLVRPALLLAPAYFCLNYTCEARYTRGTGRAERRAALSGARLLALVHGLSSLACPRRRVLLTRR